MRIWALVKRIIQQMFRDKRTLALLFVAPLLILTLMYFLFNGKTDEPELGVVDVDKGLVHVLEEVDINVKHYEHADKETVKEDNLGGLLEKKDDTLQLTLQNTDPSMANALKVKVNQAVASQVQAKIMKQNAGSPDMAKKDIDTNYVYGNDDTEYFDVLSPILAGFFVFFFVFLISGIGLLKERTTGTLERLMSTPIRRTEIVTAYLVGFGIFAVIQTLIVVLYSISVLDMVLVGSIWNVILINLLLALVALSLGTLLSTFAASEFQMVQFIPIAVIPQVFFSGIFPLESMADWLRDIGYIMPMSYGANALKGVMYKGFSLGEVRGDILALAIFSAIFIVLNVLALRRYRKL